MLVVVAKIRAKAECGDEVATQFREMVEWVTENESETLTYTCSRSRDNPNEFVFFERYTGEKAHQEHSGSPRFAELVTALRGKLDGGIEIEILDEVAAKL